MTPGGSAGFRSVVAAVTVAVALAGCGGGGGASPDASYVGMTSFTFRPARIEVPAGGKVFWRNFDKAKHTATSKEGSGFQFDTGTLRRGASRGVRFAKKGTFAYVCAFHPFMEGTVEVK